MLHYDDDTGVFTWKIRMSQSVRSGDKAGYMDDEGYWRIKIDGQLYGAHRLAIFYCFARYDELEVDHINGIRDDNRLVNLRSVTNHENNKNKALHKNNTSGVIGVGWRKARSCWQSTIMVNKKTLYLGNFHNFDDAVKARKDAEKKYGFHENHGRKQNDYK